MRNPKGARRGDQRAIFAHCLKQLYDNLIDQDSASLGFDRQVARPQHMRR
jgi:hypothetical protein